MRDRALKIELDASREFARLSGDSNPLHIDPVAARRLMFGTTVAHGVDLLMRALDHAFLCFGGGLFRSIKATFVAPLRTGSDAVIEADEPTAGNYAIRVISDGKTIQSILATLEDTAGEWPQPVLSPVGDSVQCLDLAFESLNQTSGSVPLSLDETIAAKLYPTLVRRVPPLQLAVLLATTRIVGTECPGLHSVYTGLELTFTSPSDPMDLHLRYRVAKADRRFKLLSMALDGPGTRGAIEALVRPAPVEQVTMTEVLRRVPNSQFRGRKALVIGGGRGLGETAAKILAAGGAEIWLTFAQGRADAERVVREICSAGNFRCGCFEWDVTSPPADRPAIVPADWRPSDILFFASPWISVNLGRQWDAAAFQRFCEYYVSGLARSLLAVDAVFGASDRPLRLFWPSTAFLDAPIPGLGEYVAAKAAGEALCRHLAISRRGLLTVNAPRLPRVMTDQTAGVKGASMQPVFEVLFAALR